MKESFIFYGHRRETKKKPHW